VTDELLRSVFSAIDVRERVRINLETLKIDPAGVFPHLMSPCAYLIESLSLPVDHL
jgi:hypothetical protein